MRSVLFTVVGFAALVLSAACGSDGGSGPPTGGGGSGGDDVDAGEEEIPPAPGSCQKLCCADSDCAGGACTAFAPASGTLGFCSGSGWGSEGGAGDPDAGTTLAPGCWTGVIECNPLTNEGCAAGDACDYGPGDSEVEPVVGCFGGDNTQGPGESCDNALGPWCIPGFSCVEN